MAETKPVTKRKKKSKKALFIIIGGILVILIVAAVIISGKKEKPVVVQTEKVSKRNITQVVTGTGTIQPETKVDVSAEISGQIIALPVVEGQQITKGDLLVRIYAQTYSEQVDQQKAGVHYSEAQVELAKSNLKKAELDYGRNKELFDKGLISQSDLDNARVAYEVAAATVKSSNANVSENVALLRQSGESLSKTTIKAPMDGTITALNSHLGEKVVGTALMGGTVIMTISDLNVMDAQIEISETDVSQVQVGDTATIEIDAFPDRIVKGVVYEISNTAETKNAGTQEEIVNFIVKILIIDKDLELKPGMSCNADIKVDSKSDVMSIPIQCVTARDENKAAVTPDNPDEPKRTTDENAAKKKEKPKEIVFVVLQGSPVKVKMVPVKTGISDDKYIEVTEGMTDDMEVIKGPYKAINKDLDSNSVIKIDNNPFKKPGTD